MESMLRAWLSRAAGAFAGASLAALAASPFGDFPWWAMVMPLTAGNLLAALGLSLLLLLVCAAPRARARLAPPGAWMWSGVGLGLVPIPAALGAPAPWAHAIGAALALALHFAARRARLPAPPVRALALTALLWPFVALAFAFHHDGVLRDAMEEEGRRLPALPEAAAAGPAAPGAPDLILVSVDTLRADAIVGPRPEGYSIPWFDGLRARGTWWDYALSSSNQTVPGHAGMLSGTDAMRSAVRWNRDLLPDARHLTLVSERLAAAGYRTLGVISNDLLSRALGFGRGYEWYDDRTVPRLSLVNAPLRWLQANSWLGILLDPRAIHRFLVKTQYFSAQRPPMSLGGVGRQARGQVTTDQAILALDAAYAQAQPFFFFLHYIDPHQPYGSPEGWTGRLTAGLPPLAARYAPTVRGGLYGADEIDRMGRDMASADPATAAEARAAIERMHLLYLERVMFLDDQLRRLQERLDASGRPYVLLLTSDHGEHFGEHGAVLHGTTLWEEAVRVPMILAGAGVPAGVRAEGVPSLADVTPTLLAFGGIAPPEDMPGRILQLHGAGPVGREHACADNERLAWRLDGWKAIGVRKGGDGVEPAGLYRLVDDPGETVDRLKPAGLPAAMLESLRRWLALDQYRVIQRETDFSHEMTLDSLGYAH